MCRGSVSDLRCGTNRPRRAAFGAIQRYISFSGPAWDGNICRLLPLTGKQALPSLAGARAANTDSSVGQPVKLRAHWDRWTLTEATQANIFWQTFGKTFLKFPHLSTYLWYICNLLRFGAAYRTSWVYFFLIPWLQLVEMLNSTTLCCNWISEH